VSPKRERLQIFLKRLQAAAAARSADEAFSLLCKILNAVEDEFSEVPYNPLLWRSDGRMYPPQESSRASVQNRPSLRRYRSVAHRTFIGQNGAIRIETLEGEILLDKPGEDGRKAHDLDAG
jgi:hypothetical protein